VSICLSLWSLPFAVVIVDMVSVALVLMVVVVSGITTVSMVVDAEKTMVVGVTIVCVAVEAERVVVVGAERAVNNMCRIQYSCGQSNMTNLVVLQGEFCGPN